MLNTNRLAIAAAIIVLIVATPFLGVQGLVFGVLMFILGVGFRIEITYHKVFMQRGSNLTPDDIARVVTSTEDQLKS